MKAGSERHFQQQVEQLAKSYGFNVYHAPDNRPVATRSGRVVKQRVTPGFPDLILIKAPRLIAAELKTNTGRVSKDQALWLAAFEACGVETYVWTPDTFDAMHAVLAGREDPEPPLYRQEANAA